MFREDWYDTKTYALKDSVSEEMLVPRGTMINPPIKNDPETFNNQKVVNLFKKYNNLNYEITI